MNINYLNLIYFYLMENYIILEMIGEGAFGKVYKGQRKSTNQIVAMKKIIKKYLGF